MFKLYWRYYVVFKYEDENGLLGDSGSVFTSGFRFRTDNIVETLENYLQEKKGYKKVLIINWKLLSVKLKWLGFSRKYIFNYFAAACGFLFVLFFIVSHIEFLALANGIWLLLSTLEN